MSSRWTTEVGAVFRKEWRSEMRQRSGLTTAALFSFTALVAIVTAASTIDFEGIRGGRTIAAGLIWVVIAFSAVVTVPRVFIAEEEQGTLDLLRLTANPHAVFWGKALFSLAIVGSTGLILSLLFVGMSSAKVAAWPVFLVGVLGGSAGMAGAVTLCGALVARAANRSTLAAAIAVPLLFPLIFLGVAALRVAFGFDSLDGGWGAGVGIVCYAGATYVVGPWLFAAVWKI